MPGRKVALEGLVFLSVFKADDKVREHGSRGINCRLRGRRLIWSCLANIRQRRINAGDQVGQSRDWYRILLDVGGYDFGSKFDEIIAVPSDISMLLAPVHSHPPLLTRARGWRDKGSIVHNRHAGCTVRLQISRVLVGLAWRGR